MPKMKYSLVDNFYYEKKIRNEKAKNKNAIFCPLRCYSKLQILFSVFRVWKGRCLDLYFCFKNYKI